MYVPKPLGLGRDGRRALNVWCTVPPRRGRGLYPSMGWIGLGRKFSRFGGLDWVGFIYAQSERDFSSVGRTITDARARLSAAKVEAIELVRWGLRASLISSSS